MDDPQSWADYVDDAIESFRGVISAVDPNILEKNGDRLAAIQAHAHDIQRDSEAWQEAREWVSITREPILDLNFPYKPKDRFEHILVGGFDSRHPVERGEQLTGERAFAVALDTLEAQLRSKVDLRLTFGLNTEHQRPLGNHYTPVPVLIPRDLLTAAWLQFTLYMADFNHPWRICVGCGLPFLMTRKDQTTCPGSPSCQKSRQRKERKPVSDKD